MVPDIGSKSFGTFEKQAPGKEVVPNKHGIQSTSTKLKKRLSQIMSKPRKAKAITTVKEILACDPDYRKIR